MELARVEPAFEPADHGATGLGPCRPALAVCQFAFKAAEEALGVGGPGSRDGPPVVAAGVVQRAISTGHMTDPDGIPWRPTPW